MWFLKRNNDPFGAAIKDYYSGNEDGKILVHSDVAGNEYIKVKYLFRTINQMPILERMALDACRGKVLDIGAGAGCHTIVLQNRKFDVTALEKSKEAAEVMKRMGIRHIVNSDIYRFKDGKFDTLLLLMNGIGLSGTLKGFGKFLEFSKLLLNKNGQIIFDSCDIKDIYVQNHHENLSAKKTYYGEVIYKIRYNHIRSEKFKWLFIDYNTAKKYATEAGYSVSLLGKDDDNGYLARLVFNSK
jgi:precorrin-6B methylase 2